MSPPINTTRSDIQFKYNFLTRKNLYTFYIFINNLDSAVSDSH